MNTVEIIMQCLGWVGMLLILYGMRKESRIARQAVMAAGALLLALMAFYPELHPVFFYLQSAVAVVGFINIREGTERITLPIIFLGVAASSVFALKESAGADMWFALVGLTGIAFGYAGTPEKEGGNQSLWFGVGGAGMVGYSTFGVLASVWQAWPFLILNIPFAVLGFRDTILHRRERRVKSPA